MMRDESGQATVEYLLVGLVLLAIVVSLGLLWGRVADGTFAEHITGSASHTASSDISGVVGDIAFY